MVLPKENINITIAHTVFNPLTLSINLGHITRPTLYYRYEWYLRLCVLLRRGVLLLSKRFLYGRWSLYMVDDKTSQKSMYLL